MANEMDLWGELLNQGRRKPKKGSNSTDGSPETRTEIERDYDRILFSTPVRRLADKTQVFPLEKNDSVRTRLTHSHEVSNLARSVGTTLAFKHDVASAVPDSKRNLPALLAAIGLVHDLGNPPFGHQGEFAIRSWFKENSVILNGLTKNQYKQDFLEFEGNAQGFRLVTRLQLLNDDYGLDLTFAALAAMMKYPTRSDQIDDSRVVTKKYGFFAAEQQIADDVLTKVGLKFGKRHPLTYIMEACDDIAYVVLDVEDSIKKGLTSFSDLLAYLKHHGNGDPLIKEVVEESSKKHDQYRMQYKEASPAELNDVSMQRFRAYAIGALIRAITDAFVQNQVGYLNGSVEIELLKNSTGSKLRSVLKDFALKHAYTHRSVLKVELQGYNVIRSLMDMFWASIVDRTNNDVVESARKQPFTRFVYQRISENYRRVFETSSGAASSLPQRYRECLLLTDMISGMTDSFAMDLYNELNELKGDFDPEKFKK